MELALPPVTLVVLAPPGRAEALASALAPTGDGPARVEVVAGGDADEVAALVAAGTPDVLVASAGADELAAAGRIAAASPGTRVLVVGAADPESLIDGGAGAVVDESIADDDLQAAVVGLHLGEARVDAALAAAVRERISAEGSGLVPLSDTEDEVLSRLAAGESVDTLAEAYAVSPRLVRQVAGGALSRVVLGRLVGA